VALKFADIRGNVSNAICALCLLIEMVWVNVNFASKFGENEKVSILKKSMQEPKFDCKQ
jgi:hypothetical protein